MKCFEKVVKEKLLTFVDLDSSKFEYKKDGRDACTALNHHLRSHLDQPSSYTRILFVNFTATFQYHHAKYFTR